MKYLVLLALFVLAGCSGSQTQLYDNNGVGKGHVTVSGTDYATIVNRAGSIVGEVKGSEILSRNGEKAGEVRNGTEILDRNGVRKGFVRDEECFDRNEVEVGHFTRDIDDEAAGGACYLLLLLP